MDEKKPTVVVEPAVAPKEIPSTPTLSDGEARIAQLEKEKQDLMVEASNYKVAFLKEKSKNEAPVDETEEEKIKRITLETISQNKIAQIDVEKDKLLKQLAKENAELKLAHLNKTPVTPQSMGSHNEGTPIKDTLVTADQIAAFKAKGWTDKDIERYKKNLNRYAR